MADDMLPEDDQTPKVSLPPLVSLPPPPEISFTRPTLGRSKSTQTTQTEADRVSHSSNKTAPASFNLGVGMSAGITLASSVVVGFLVGQWIDHHWHLSLPWGTIAFSLAGVAAGFINLFRILAVSDKSEKK